jgi:hypothetical protein
MTRKSKIVTLSILGVVAAVGVLCCCFGPWFEDEHDEKDKDGQGGRGGHVRRRYTPRWFPIFFGGSTYHGGGGVAHGGSHSGTGRGGFGSTGGHSGGGIGA